MGQIMEGLRVVVRTRVDGSHRGGFGQRCFCSTGPLGLLCGEQTHRVEGRRRDTSQEATAGVQARAMVAQSRVVGRDGRSRRTPDYLEHWPNWMAMGRVPMTQCCEMNQPETQWLKAIKTIS